VALALAERLVCKCSLGVTADLCLDKKTDRNTNEGRLQMQQVDIVNYLKARYEYSALVCWTEQAKDDSY